MQFCVYTNTNPKSKKPSPFLLDVQSNLHEDLTPRVVVPLIPKSIVKDPIAYLNPQFVVDKKNMVMSTAELAGVDKKILGEKVCSLDKHRDEIIGALDFLLTGF